jgi:general secretion pathway protein J
VNARRASGFTLLELLVVLLVFAVLSVMAYGGLKTVLDARVGVEASLDRTAALQRGYRKLRDDLRLLRYRPIRDGFGDLQPALLSERGLGVVFTRGGWRNPLTAPRASLERVRYRLNEGRLYRDSWRVLDQAQDSPVVELALIEGVEDLRWRFLDNAREWRDDWPADRGDLPLLIEMRLETEDWGELTWLFRPAVSAAAVATLSQFNPSQTGEDGPPSADTPADTPAETPGNGVGEPTGNPP